MVYDYEFITHNTGQYNPLYTLDNQVFIVIPAELGSISSPKNTLNNNFSPFSKTRRVWECPSKTPEKQRGEWLGEKNQDPKVYDTNHLEDHPSYIVSS